MVIFNPKDWEIKIQDYRWYDDIPALFKKLDELKETNSEEFKVQKEAIYNFFDKNLLDGKIALADVNARNNQEWNESRKPIDTIVIHHTGHPGREMPLSRLNAMELIRLYAPVYARREGKGPIYSGHIRDGKQVFYPYHWMIGKSGIPQRLLHDSEVGWQAGNWEVNCRSVAICIDNDHRNSAPSYTELKTIAELIKNNYPQVTRERILGHREINTKTDCPGELFLSTPDRKGWKDMLLDLIFDAK